MKRESDIVTILHQAYDDLVNNGQISFSNVANIRPGIFIDPGIGSAQAQTISKFIYGYDGDEKDRIISISDVYCQKLWVTCYLVAKLLIKAGYITSGNESKYSFTEKYSITNNDLIGIANECVSIVNEKIDYLRAGAENISEELIKEIDKYSDPDKGNSNLKYELSYDILRYSIKTILLHEYSHIYNKDKEKEDIHVIIGNEKRADLDAITWLTANEVDNNIFAYIGAICLHASELFSSRTLENLDHPDKDLRIKYTIGEIPMNDDIKPLISDILFILTYVWANINGRTEQLSTIGTRPTYESLLNYLSQEKDIIAQELYEEGRRAMAKKIKERKK